MKKKPKGSSPLKKNFEKIGLSVPDTAVGSFVSSNSQKKKVEKPKM